MDRAARALERALSLGEPEGYVRVFLDGGPPIAGLLAHLAERRTRGQAKGSSAWSLAFVQRLLGLFGEAGSRPPSPAGTQPLAEPLTDRELEVLRRIAAGASNREIAQEFVVALSTVKTHVNNILSKLNARSRTQAVARAREMGLLPD